MEETEETAFFFLFDSFLSRRLDKLDFATNSVLALFDSFPSSRLDELDFVVNSFLVLFDSFLSTSA